MEWNEKYGSDNQPNMKQIGEYIDSPLWDELISHMENIYQITPRIEYSKCSMNKGWNVKFKKGSWSVCTLYPEEGFFICLVTIGRKETVEAELLLGSCSEYVRNVYANAGALNGAKWLMIEVRTDSVLGDVKELTGLRVKKKTG